MHSGPFDCVTNLGGERAELVQKFVPRSCVRIFRNECTRSTPLDPKLTFWRVFHTIWVHSRPFGCLTKLGAKRAELVQKFVSRSRIGIFHNECTRSTPFNPKLTFWCISYHLGAFGTIWLPYEPRWKTGRTSAKVRATKSRRKFLQRMHPIQPFDPKLTFWCVSYRLGAFGTVWLPYKTRCKTGRTSAKVRATNLRRNFSQQTHPIHPIGP